MSRTLNSLEGGYIGDYIGEYYGDTRSLDNGLNQQEYAAVKESQENQKLFWKTPSPKP